MALAFPEMSLFARPTWQATTSGSNVVGTIVQEAVGVGFLGNSTKVMGDVQHANGGYMILYGIILCYTYMILHFDNCNFIYINVD